MFGILLFVGVALLIYSVVTQYQNTDPTENVLKRVWGAVVLGVGVLVTAVGGWFSGIIG